MTDPTISFQQAQEIMLKIAADCAPAWGSERIEFTRSLGRVLAEDIHADRPMPPFPRAAVDGYACRAQDLPGKLRIIEEIPAGSWPTRTIQPGTCSRIMTGAPLPPGADCIVMVEDTTEPEAGFMATDLTTSPANYCPTGEDVAAGETVLARGCRLLPSHIAILATFGATMPRVARQPHALVFATGDELVEPWQQPADAQIRNSNAAQTCAQLQIWGVQPHYGGIIPDDPRQTEQILTAAIASRPDLIFLSGGISMGNFDFIPATLEKLSFTLHFRKVKMKPGKPTIFAQRDNTFCIALPGNPVSSLVVNEILVRPFIQRLVGCTDPILTVKARLGAPIRNKGGKRQLTIPVSFRDSQTVVPVPYHGSGHIHAYTRAQAILILPPGDELYPEGTPVDVRPLWT